MENNNKKLINFKIKFKMKNYKYILIEFLIFIKFSFIILLNKMKI
jgi:hypothetical protein